MHEFDISQTHQEPEKRIQNIQGLNSRGKQFRKENNFKKINASKCLS